MKKGILFLLAVVLCSFVFRGNAQNLKFGHINSSDLIMIMPERDSANKQLEAYGKEMEAIYEEMLVEHNRKLDDYQKNIDKWQDAVKSAREKEIVDIQRRLQEQQQAFQQGVQEMQQKLFAPIYEKVRNAIEKTAKANALIYVFETGNLLYFNESQSMDLMPLVKKELNLK